MQRNGFYAAVKTDDGVQAVYIDENIYRIQQEQAAAQKRKKARKAQRQKRIECETRHRNETVHVLKQELKLLGAGAILWLGYSAGLVELAFALPVLIAFQTVICFRAGKWVGKHGSKKN